MFRSKPHPDQLALELTADAELEAIVAARVAARAEADALRWRFRLIIIESVMMTTLVIAAGIALDQPTGMVVRGALVIGVSCFVTGLLLIGLTGAASRLMARWRRAR
ncbi:MAG: hypothetical protein ACOY4N_00075 [Pseudomonadota bacterium]|jgi:hypothetical protein|uniref:hypothetical protein n=1 Tax=Novosphingobium sp. CCH12-A3 TaxID=1768752 RepID=UPI0007850BDF|nr:hypothetical protein [Novosphingobium sp. CCH12-A3]